MKASEDKDKRRHVGKEKWGIWKMEKEITHFICERHTHGMLKVHRCIINNSLSICTAKVSPLSYSINRNWSWFRSIYKLILHYTYMCVYNRMVILLCIWWPLNLVGSYCIYLTSVFSVGCDTRSIFLGCIRLVWIKSFPSLTKTKTNLLHYLSIAGDRRDKFLPPLRLLAQYEMKRASFRIWFGFFV